MAIINKEIPFPYISARNPDTTPPEEFLNEPEKGGNCELMVQAFVSARGFKLPRLRSSELYEDTEYTMRVRDLSQVETGDIIGLRPEKKKDFRGVHEGMIWVDNEGEIYIVHNAKHLGHARIEPLGEALVFPQHEAIAWIKRPIVEDPSLLQSDKLRELGFDILARKV